MNTNILVTASAMSDQDLLARLAGLAGAEREALVELVAHLAALDIRPAVYAAQGYGSLFTYCTQALRLSEDATCNRIAAARACRRFPLILDLLAAGSLTLTSVRLLGRHLTAENHQSVLAKASHATRHQIEALVAELAPRPDLPSAVRKVPCFTKTLPPFSGPGLVPSSGAEGHSVVNACGGPVSALGLAPSSVPAMATTRLPSGAGTAIASSPSALPATPRPIVQALAPERYRVQFTIGQETHDKLRRLQALLRREIPDGDPGVIFERALTMLLEKVERTKLAAAAKPRPNRLIRPAADKEPGLAPALVSPALLTGRVPPTEPSVHVPAVPSRHVPPAAPSRLVAPAHPSRNVPREVKREVWRRDAGQCAFVSTGRRCTEHTFLEFHHVKPYARQGPATVANISLRCWRHNQYEAELIFGAHGPSTVREARVSYGDTSGNRASSGAS